MQTNNFKSLGAILIIVGALVFLYMTMTPSAPVVNRKPFEALGQVAAEEAQKYIGAGGRIALIARDTRAYPNPHMDYICSAFVKACAQSKLPVISTNRLKIDPLSATRVPLGDYVDLFTKLTEKDVIVSFMGPPMLTTPDDRKKFPDKGPKVVALCLDPVPKQVNLKSLFAEELLHSAIISRPAPDIALPKGGNPRAWFDHFYQVLTRTNLNELPISTEIASLRPL